jgi:hypothetical protein
VDILLNRLTNVPSESTALTTGLEGKQFQAKAWKEIMDVLKQQTGGFDDVLEEYDRPT